MTNERREETDEAGVASIFSQILVKQRASNDSRSKISRIIQANYYYRLYNCTATIIAISKIGGAMDTL